MRWGVLGARSRIYRNRLRPAFALARQPIVAEGSRRGDDVSAYDAVVTDPDVDAVYIPLPNALHVEWVTKALESGKHVLCEKPLTLAAATTERLYAVAAEAGRHLGEAYMWPHHPRAEALLRFVADGGLGRLVGHHSAFQYSIEPGDHRLDERGGGALSDVGIYCLGPALMMTGGDVGAVAATAVRNEAGVDTAMTGWVSLDDAASATFLVSCDAAPRRTQEIVGSEGTIVVANPSPGPERAGTVIVDRRDGSTDEIAHGGANAYERMISAFERECRGEVEPRWTPELSIRLAHVIDRLHATTSGNRD